MIKIEICKSYDINCDEFVKNMSSSRFCHFFAWSRMLTEVMGYHCFYLVARRGALVEGVLPLTQVKSRLFGNRMISQAFSNYGGILSASDEARDALFKYAVELAQSLHCSSIEFRNTEPLPYNLQKREGKISMILELKPDFDVLWNSFPAKVRNQVRKAEKSGIESFGGGLELFEDFYRIYSVRMHQLGTPHYPAKIMTSILKTFPNESKIFIVRYGGKAIGAGLVISLGTIVEIPWAATLVEFNSLCPNNLLYWSIIKYYCFSGAKYFDFGRCTEDSGTYNFKKQWGSQPLDLNYQFWVAPDKKFSLVSPDNPKYKKKVEMWRKLPFFLVRFLGPLISRHLP